ncbi:MAG: TetR/AcrR family transcriptional regulator [Syntrophales bacterium]|nr:TetR/AcrR family transcriptional regulator [Syntrophales bacterium]MCK9528920.1 TetR/AcrR family transcriptional regulator [Syntrophales bacterium]MDX9922516.1 helix-turn-helix domain-containing protein [Syntrophales bacterium]
MIDHPHPQSKDSATTAGIPTAARDVFSKSGFDATGRVDEIARRAGVNKATLRYHIGNKEKLYETVIFGVINRVIDTTTRDIQKAPTPEAKLRTYIKTMV